MKVTAIEATNLRAFKEIPKLDLSKTINIFIGPNNSGKSTILKSILNLQKISLSSHDITKGESAGSLNLYVEGQHKHNAFGIYKPNLIRYNLAVNQEIKRFFGTLDHTELFPWHDLIPPLEPHNLIYPYLSKRKVTNYDYNINEQARKSVTGDLTHLYAKIDYLNTKQLDSHSQYIKACNDILGYEISTIANGSGKGAVYFVYDDKHVPLSEMGEGVANILGLVVDLCVAQNQIFIIEEPENDIHPKALKALLRLIAEKSATNQFFISTHSNIVMKYLGAERDTKIFHIESQNDVIPNLPKLFVSTINEVSNEPNERERILTDLGYDFCDFNLWSGWLFLEESSAERLIRDYFIGWYSPALFNKLRTFSAGGRDKVVPRFDDFNRLFTFLHLDPTYKNRAWVIIDSGDAEKEIIDQMKKTYRKSGWDESHFIQFDQHDFEKYYPSIFKDDVSEILAIQNGKEKNDCKLKLLNKVIAWIEQDKDRAKKEFEISAQNVISILKEIEKAL